jgi:endonuclease YncB( thermonuclease family)
MSYRLRRKHGISLLVVLLVACITLGQQQGWFGQAAKGVLTNQPGLYSIDHYVDGDTIVVTMNGTPETIRFIGIDTPETHKPNTPVQCYGPAAAAHTRNVIEAAGGKVRLVSDSLSTNRDRYDRLLRYVYLPDGTDVNQLNVEQGYAFYYPYFPFSKKAGFKAAEQAAMAAKKGLWGACKPTPSDNGGYKMDETQAQASA